MGINKQHMALHGEVKRAILEFLARSPEGRTARQIAAAIDRARDGVASRLAELQATGRVLGVIAHNKKARDSKLWFDLQYEANARQAGDPGFVRSRTVAKALAPKPTRRGDGVIVVTAPKFVDRRWEPDGEVPRVVDSAQARPWAVAATGGTNAVG